MNYAIILGGNGMLGSALKRYLEVASDWSVQCYNRSIDGPLDAFLEQVEMRGDSVVFNCVGSIPQKKPSVEELYTANYWVPALLTKTLPSDVTLIQPSTDCVFSGKKASFYNKDDDDHSLDHYGLSKRAGENIVLKRPNSFVIRTSIIGLGDHASDKGLLNWVLSKKGKDVEGYTNHFWNGVTTLEWIKMVLEILQAQHGGRPGSLIQLGLDHPLSKCGLLVLIDRVFKLNLKIKPIMVDYTSRLLASDYQIKCIQKQLVEFEEWIAAR